MRTMAGLIAVAIAQYAIVGRGSNEDYLIDNLHDLEFHGDVDVVHRVVCTKSF